MTPQNIKEKLMEAHAAAVKRGRHETARKILHLLNKRELRIGLDDVAFEVEDIVASAGCRIAYSRNFYSALIRY